MNAIAKLYCLVCIGFSVFLPHITDDDVSTAMQIILQITFLVVGYIGMKTFQGD